MKRPVQFEKAIDELSPEWKKLSPAELLAELAVFARELIELRATLSTQTEELNRVRQEAAENRAHRANAEGLKREVEALKAIVPPKPPAAAVPAQIPMASPYSLAKPRSLFDGLPSGTRIKLTLP